MPISDYHVVGDASLAQSPSGQTTIVIQTPDKANQLSYNNTSSGLSGTNVQSAIDEVDGRIDALSSNGAKNLLPMTLEGMKSANTSGTWSDNAYTYNGVTFTIQTDSDDNVIGIVANGTASGAHALFIFGSMSLQSTNTYKYNGNPSSGLSSNCRIDIFNSDTSYFKSVTTDGDFTVEPINNDSYYIRIAILNGYGASNLLFKPMLRLASDTDSTFQPYAKTNLELTDNVRDIDYRLEGNACANLLPMTLAGIKALNTTGTWSGNAYTYNGVTFTVNTDNNGNVTGIATSGTASAQSVFNIYKGDFSKYIGNLLSGSIGGAVDSYRLKLDLQQSPWTTYITQYSDSVEVPNTVASSDSMLFIDVRTSGVDMTGKTFYPMISRNPNATYEPYYPSNRELKVLKNITFRDTTSNQGNLTVPNLTNVVPVFSQVLITSNMATRVGIPAVSSGGTVYIYVIDNDGNSTVVKNTQCDCTLYYYEL